MFKKPLWQTVWTQIRLFRAVCSGSTLFASILNSPVMLGNYLQQTTSADYIFRCIFFLGALRVQGRFVLFQIKDICYELKLPLSGSLQDQIHVLLHHTYFQLFGLKKVLFCFRLKTYVMSLNYHYQVLSKIKYYYIVRPIMGTDNFSK